MYMQKCKKIYINMPITNFFCAFSKGFSPEELSWLENRVLAPISPMQEEILYWGDDPNPSAGLLRGHTK